MPELVMFYAFFCLAAGSSSSELPVDWFRMPFQHNYWFWKAVGFTGLALFQARWIVQWLYSEKHKESRMPVSFWWLSLTGSLLELCYFLRQQDSVGIVGCLNFFPYMRNLILIYRKKRRPDVRGFPAIGDNGTAGAGAAQPSGAAQTDARHT